MKRATRVDWTFMKGDSATCQRCGGTERVPLPMPIESFPPWVAYFNSQHQRCEAPAGEPTAPPKGGET